MLTADPHLGPKLTYFRGTHLLPYKSARRLDTEHSSSCGERCDSLKPNGSWDTICLLPSVGCIDIGCPCSECNVKILSSGMYRRVMHSEGNFAFIFRVK
jgi:hypothetical protein